MKHLTPLTILIAIFPLFLLLVLPRYVPSKSAAHTSPLSVSSILNPENFLRTRMAACMQNNGLTQCYRDLAFDLLAQAPIRTIFEAIAHSEQYPEVFSQCHQLTHFLARAHYAHTKDVPLAFNSCTSACHGGCYHGVIEGYFKEYNIDIGALDDALIAQQIRTVCGQERTHASPRIYNECLHGIGHAMMFITEADLPRSLALCDALATLSEREACYGGVFMENSSSSTNRDHPTKYLNREDPLYPCSILADQYKTICYQYQSSYFAELSQWDWSHTIALCEKVPIPYRERCMHIIGSNQVGYTQDTALMLSTCNLIKEPAYTASCIGGIVSALGGRYVGEHARMQEFCAMVDAPHKSSCYGQIGDVLESWGLSTLERERICKQTVETSYIPICTHPLPKKINNL